MSSGSLAVSGEHPVALEPGGPIGPGPGLDEIARSGVSWRRVLTDRALMGPLIVLGVMVLLAIFGPIVWGKSADQQNLLEALESPSFVHPMGTDQLGRDILARVLEGARISIGIATLVTLSGAFVGSAIGLVAGTIGGFFDNIPMRVMDAILAFPPLILAMAVTVGLGIGLLPAAVGMALVSVPWYARLIRSEALRIRALPFIEAANAIGSTRGRIIRRHVVPHLLPVLLIQMAAAFGFAIVLLAGLSFVGLGAQIPTPEWGAMITDGLPYALTGQWWVSVFPGIALMITVTAANMLSDRMRDVLDPRGDYAHI